MKSPKETARSTGQQSAPEKTNTGTLSAQQTNVNAIPAQKANLAAARIVEGSLSRLTLPCIRVTDWLKDLTFRATERRLRLEGHHEQR